MPVPAGAERPRRLVGVSLKSYFGLRQTRSWARNVAALVHDGRLPRNVELFVLPDFVSLTAVAGVLHGTGVACGAQDVCPHGPGPYTGEVSAAVLAEAGCRYAEVGHAERRGLFGEDDETTARRARAAARAGLIPLVCVGEESAHDPDAAAAHCLSQARAVLSRTGHEADVVFAYEPVWAIGARQPASPGHVGRVVRELRAGLPARDGSTRVLYGGSAGPGLFADIADSVDGLFLGRFAHDVEALATVLTEVAA